MSAISYFLKILWKNVLILLLHLKFNSELPIALRTESFLSL